MNTYTVIFFSADHEVVGSSDVEADSACAAVEVYIEVYMQTNRLRPAANYVEVICETGLTFSFDVQ